LTDILGLAGVASHGERFAARFIDGLRNNIQVGLFARGQHHGRAVLRHAARNGLADAAARAGHHRHLPCKTEIRDCHGSLLCWKRRIIPKSCVQADREISIYSREGLDARLRGHDGILRTHHSFPS